MRTAREQRREASRSTTSSKRANAAAPARAIEAVAKVALDGEVREQAAVLEHVADAAPLGGHVDAARAVDQRLAVERDVARVRAQHAGDDVRDRGLAGAAARRTAP